jgi:hypothetical protein
LWRREAERDTVTTPLGTILYLQSVQSNMHIYAVVTDGSTPNLNTITVEVNADESTVIVPGLIGPTGPAGAPQFALNLQFDIFSSPAQLPTDYDGEIGDYFLIEQTDDNGNVISSAAYIWWGSFWRVLPFGTQGPTGPYPVVTPQVILIDPDESSYVENTGTIANPSWTYFLAVPAGPPGPDATLAGCPDVNESTPPTTGQVLGFNGQYNDGLPVYQPMTVGAISVMPYIVPESAFTSYTGISSSTQSIASFAVPPNPFAWKPLVWGQIEVTGIEFSTSPLLINVEVLLGDPNTGTLVATGYGNALGGVVTIVPQTSSTTSTNAAMTPTNSTALVPANHTGNTGTLYVNLVNDGVAAVFSYGAQNSQLMVLACPATTEGAVNAGIYGSLSTKVTLSASTVTQGS